eukprot:TRINITY_DN40850_c0_g1_i1.p1 TRINITY_DN40850_c0_g1~~TRINITY_DN40850_c0_g1_i1.p1  ORF type:complete len:390 (-),score=53.23 TRINITY_DN40850_c0_g1_i1:52-1149(-)
MQADQLASAGTGSSTLESVETICTVILTMELIPRSIFFLHGDPVKGRVCDGVFFFDAIIVLLAWSDFVLGLCLGSRNDQDEALATLLTIARSARSLRLCRLVCFVPQIRVVILTIVNTLPEFCWLGVLMVCVIFVFAIPITEGAARFVHDGEVPDDLAENIKEDFGYVTKAMYTLFKCVIGGVNWGEPARLMIHIGSGYLAVFIVYISLMIFSVLNVVLGFFVDGAIQLMERDRQLCRERSVAKNKRLADDLLTMLASLDKDSDGTITFSEWLDAIADGETRVLLEAMGFDSTEASNVFASIDVDNNGIVSLPELVGGIQRIKCKPTALHMDLLMRRTSCLDNILKKMEELDARLRTRETLRAQG